MKQVVVPINLGKTIKAAHLAANKYDVNIDNATIIVDANGVLSTALDPAKVDALIALSGVAALSSNLGTFSGITIADNATVKLALQALENAVENLNIVGQYAGSAATLAALPTTTSDGKPINNSDWAILTADDGTNQAGIYVYNGTAYTMAAEIPNQFTLAATAISPAATDVTGAIGTTDRYAREDHKHPAQVVSADAAQALEVGTDGLHLFKIDPISGNLLRKTAAGNKVDPADVLALHTASEEVQDAFGNVLFYAHITTNM